MTSEIPEERVIGKEILDAVHEGAAEGARSQKISWTDRRVQIIFAFVVATSLLTGWYGQETTSGLQHRIEHRMCTFLVPLLPKSSSEVPHTGYGKRVLAGVSEGAKQNHCPLRAMPKP